MFESAELGHKVDKRAYAREEPALRADLLDAQMDVVADGSFPILLVIGGVDGAGKGETVNLLHEWMDPRYLETHAIDKPTDEERHRPPLFRFWRRLPPKGRMGIFFGSWYTDPIVDRVKGGKGDAALAESVEQILRFERLLAADGALIVKIWFHLSKKDQHRRLRTLEKNPDTRWRVTKQDWKNYRHYDEFREIDERVLRQTSTPEAPWVVVEGKDARYRSLTVGKVLLAAIRERLAQRKPVARKREPPIVPSIDGVQILRTLDLTRSTSEKKYDATLERLQGRLNLLTRHPHFERRAAVVVFEGSDAAGKGGAIRRIASALDARRYRTVAIAAPTEEERAQPYLWRFWRHVPGRGHMTVFDRSWYGRVLVERVEGFAAPETWGRAYSEINDFEEQLTASGVTVVKFWLAVSKDEQLRRFRERETTRFKRFKITPEDWRNRKKWDDYEVAACEMIDRTSTDVAPWTLVESNDKRYARLKILETLVTRLERAL